MSEQGWREFLAADGVEDWVVLHGGASAVFRVRSLQDAAHLAEAVSRVVDGGPSDVLMTVADRQLTVRLARGVFRLEQEHIDIARRISAVAHEHGAVADRHRNNEVQVAVAARPDSIDVNFWRAALGYDPLADDNAVDPLGHGSTVWLQELDENGSTQHAMHVDVSVAREHVQARLDTALAAGGRIVRHWEDPEAWTLADRSGNRVCICAWPDGAGPQTPTTTGDGP